MADSEQTIKRAEELAKRAHEGQRRKYTDEPYIVHPRQIALRAEAMLNFSFEDWRRLVCAAWLHDVLEDCPQISEQEVIDACGADVLALVKEVTNPSNNSKERRAVRKQMDRDHLAKASYLGKTLKKLDRIANLKDMLRDSDHVDASFMRLTVAESLSLYQVLKTGDHLDQELADVIEELDRCAELKTVST